MKSHSDKRVLSTIASRVIIDPTTGCYEYLGTIDSHGYARISYKGKQGLVTRVLHEIHFWKLPSNVFMCHKCDNPRCVNLNHIFLGNHLDNNRDKISKGRGLRGETVGTAKLTAADIEFIMNYPRYYGSTKELAGKFSIVPHTVYMIRKGLAWQHV